MAIDQPNVVDSIGIDPSKDEVQLIISDHLNWAHGEKKDNEHMYLLQEKINTYLRFVESGELYTVYPRAKGKNVVIRVIGKYEMSPEGKTFYAKIEGVLIAAGHAITFERHES